MVFDMTLWLVGCSSNVSEVNDFLDRLSEKVEDKCQKNYFVKIIVI